MVLIPVGDGCCKFETDSSWQFAKVIQNCCDKVSGFLKNPFEIRFYKPKGGNDKADFSNDIVSILESMNFEFSVEPFGFWISEETAEKTMITIETLRSRLKLL